MDKAISRQIFNGNLTSDANRGVAEVRYNCINLPSLIAFSNVRWMENVYRADGVKLSTELLSGTLPESDVTIKSLISGESVMAAGDDAAVEPLATKPSLRKVLESKTYLGNYEFSGDSLVRLNTSYGYFLGGRFYANAYDYQGNLAASGQGSSAAQQNGYYPYGLPVRGGGETGKTPYLYGGKEFEPRQGLNIYDFLARTYAPDEARFWQPDPNAGDYPGISPYVFCAADPVNFVDPDGMKVFYVDMTGRIISSEEAMKNNSNLIGYENEYESLDIVIILDKDGNVVDKSETFKEGTIENTIVNKALGKDKKAVDVTAFQIRGDNAGRTIFEFLSNNLTVQGIGIEFSHIKAGQAGKKGLNFVSTSHTVASEAGAGWLFTQQLQFGYTLREWIHSHPTSDSADNTDLSIRKIVQNSWNKKYSSILFKIYHVPTKKYIDYPRDEHN